MQYNIQFIVLGIITVIITLSSVAYKMGAPEKFLIKALIGSILVTIAVNLNLTIMK